MTGPALKAPPTGFSYADRVIAKYRALGAALKADLPNRLDETEVECPDCDGSGIVPPSGNAPYWDREMEECYECNGRGCVA